MEDGRERNQKSPELVMPGEGTCCKNQKTHQSNIFCRKTESSPFAKAIKWAGNGALLLRSLSWGVLRRPGLTVEMCIETELLDSKGDDGVWK